MKTKNSICFSPQSSGAINFQEYSKVLFCKKYDDQKIGRSLFFIEKKFVKKTLIQKINELR